MVFMLNFMCIYIIVYQKVFIYTYRTIITSGFLWRLQGSQHFGSSRQENLTWNCCRVYRNVMSGKLGQGRPVCGRHNPGATEEENMVGFHHDDEYTPEDQHRTWKWWFGSDHFPLPGGLFSGSSLIIFRGVGNLGARIGKWRLREILSKCTFEQWPKPCLFALLEGMVQPGNMGIVIQ